MSGRYQFDNIRWCSPNNSCQGIDLQVCFNDVNFNVAKLLTNPQMANEAKRQSEEMSEKLVQNKHILEELIKVCVDPFQFKHREIPEVLKQHTFRALEIITNLNQKFSEYLLKVQGISQEDDVVTEESQNISTHCPLIETVFYPLSRPGPFQQTPLWYMYKIGIAACYQNPKQVMKVFQNQSACKLVMRHLYSNAILDWAIKLIQMEDSQTFFEKQKISILINIVESINEQQNYELKLCMYENYQIILNTILQKMQDRFDKVKFIGLAKQFISLNIGIKYVQQQLLKFISQQNNQNNQLFVLLLQISEKYLHFSSNYRNNANIISLLNTSQNNSVLKSRNNLGVHNNYSGIHNNSSSGLDASVHIDIPLDNQTAAKLRQFVSKYLKNVQNYTQINLFVLIALIRLIKSLIICLQISENSQVQCLLSDQTIAFLMSKFSSHKGCNVLHNQIRDAFTAGVHKNFQYLVPALLKCSFTDFVSSIKSKANSGESEFDNQLYHVFQQIIKKGEQPVNSKVIQNLSKNIESFEDMILKIKQKEKIYNVLIGGNPRKDSSCWGDSSQGENKHFSFSYNNNNEGLNKLADDILLGSTTNDAIEGKIQHWIQCEDLPLDSDESREDSNSYNENNLKQDNQGQDKKENILKEENEFQNELAKRFKNAGVVECEEEQIRVIKKKTNNRKNSKKIRHNSDSAPQNEQNNASSSQKVDLVNVSSESKQLKQDQKDSQEAELEREILIMQSKRLNCLDEINDDDSPEIKIRIKKTVDSIDEQNSKSDFFSAKVLERIQVEGLMDSSKQASKQNVHLNNSENISQSQQNKGQQKNFISDKQIKYKQEQIQQQKSEKQKIPNSPEKEFNSQHFQKYLNFNIDKILLEMQ